MASQPEPLKRAKLHKIMRSRFRAARWGFLIGILAAQSLFSADAAPDLQSEFTQTVRPFIDQFCVGCHSGVTPAAQLDLKSFTTLSSVVHDMPHWTLLVERLERQEMPPKPVPQPPAEARRQVVDWVKSMRANELRKNVGDAKARLATSIIAAQLVMPVSRAVLIQSGTARPKSSGRAILIQIRREKASSKRTIANVQALRM